MDIGQRLKVLRESKKFSQGDLEERTGLLRFYISRVENGHTIPSIKTLKRLSQALGIKLYEFLYDGDTPLNGAKPDEGFEKEWGGTGTDARFLRKLRRSLGKMDERERNVLLTFAKALVKPKKQ